MKKTTSNKGKYFIGFLLFIVIAGAYGGLLYTYQKAENLQNMLNLQKAEIQANKKIYYYNLEEVLRALDVVSARTKFETEVLKLNDELFAAEEKIKSIKDAKVKDDFSDVYLNNLKLKRDELVANYEKNLKEMTDKINEALVAVALEKKTSTIFQQTAIAVNTNDSEDVSAEIIARVKKLSK